MLKPMYSIFLGLVIVMFVGVGVATFYSEPEVPEENEDIIFIDESDGQPVVTEEQKLAQEKRDAEWEAYDANLSDYNRNVAIITMVVSVALLYVGLSKAENLAGVSEGLLLGGVFTLFYSLVRGLMSGDDMMRFIVITLGLVIAIWLGKNKFNKEVPTKV